MASDEFDRGVRWMEEGRCEQKPIGDKDLCHKARGAFQRAFGIYPEGLGALRNLATVERALGLWASAARSYRELARRAPLDPKPARRGWATIAVRELSEIENLAARVVINIPDPAPAGTLATLDGVEVPAAAWRVPIELDPGDHTLSVAATGARTFQLAFSVRTSEIRSVTVDLTVESKPDAPAAVATSVATPSLTIPATTPAQAQVSHPHRRWAFVVMAAGGLGVAAGVGFGAAALAERDKGCNSDLVCNRDALNNGLMMADVATVAIVAGVVTVGAGLGWYLWDRRTTRDGAPPKSRTPLPVTPPTARLTPTLGPGQLGLVFHARF